MVTLRRRSVTQSIYTCRKYYLKTTCPLLVLNSAHAVMDDALNIHYNTYGVHLNYPPEMYFPVQDGFGVCPVNRSWVKLVHQIETYISLGGSAVSVVCLACSLVTFGWSRAEYPGHGMVSLCVCLLIADALFLLIGVMYF